MSRAWRNGSSRMWRRVRAAVLARDSVRGVPMCRVKVPGVCTEYADTGHHVKGREVTGDDPRWVVASCTPCNLHIGDPRVHARVCTTCRPRTRKVTKW